MLRRPKVAETTLLDKLHPKNEGEHLSESSQRQLKYLQGRETGYRFVNVRSAVNLGIQATLDHQRTNPKCEDQPKLMPDAEIRRGLGVSETLACGKCGFQTGNTKLYAEIPSTGRGRRTAAPNMALQVGLYNHGGILASQR